MKYTLAVLTHGDALSGTLAQALDSFDESVSPRPNNRIIHRDPGFGFCSATRSLWEKAAAAGDDFIFWLEHDFVFLRQIDLRGASLILEDESIGQVQLMRESVNDVEREAGGVVAKHQARGDLFESQTTEGVPFLRHSAYLTTNPSLMRNSFMAQNPWPEHESECEGKFGIELRQRGYSFAILGDGEPWVDHIGVRSGFGY